MELLLFLDFEGLIAAFLRCNRFGLAFFAVPHVLSAYLPCAFGDESRWDCIFSIRITETSSCVQQTPVSGFSLASSWSVFYRVCLVPLSSAKPTYPVYASWFDVESAYRE
jgi:hypothetical protein